MVQGFAQGSIADSVSTFLIEENMDVFLGFGVNITQYGHPDFSFTHGYKDNELESPFSDSTIFNLGSVSKLFTAIAVMKLAEEEVIKLDDPVYYYFPEFLDIQGKSRSAPEVRIIDLLQHRSGISQSIENLFPELFDRVVLNSEEEFYENTYNYRAFLTHEDFKNRFLMYAKMEKKPGTYQFSNLGYVILGYLVQEVTGINLAQFVTNKIFVPLEMTDTHYYMTPDSLEPRLARGYYRMTDGSYLNVHENEVENPGSTGDGGVKTSLRDMRKFMHFLTGDTLAEKHGRILSRAGLLSMISPLEKGPDKDTYIGLGFHNIQPYNLAGHAGGWDGFQSILYYHPETQSCLFLITNREDNEIFLFLRFYAAYAMLFKDFER